MGELIWAGAVYPGADPRHALAVYGARVMQKITAVEAQLSDEWLCGPRPGLADFFACESLAALRQLLGPERDARLRLRLPRLFEHSSAVARRANHSGSPPLRPANLTSHPDEPAILARLASADLDALGL